MEEQDYKAPLILRILDKLISPLFRGSKRTSIADWRYQKGYFTYCLYCTAGPTLFFALLLFDVMNGAMYDVGYFANDAGLFVVSVWMGLAMLALLTAVVSSLSISAILAGRDLELERRLKKIADGEALDSSEYTFRDEDVAASSHISQRIVEIDDRIQSLQSDSSDEEE